MNNFDVLISSAYSLGALMFIRAGYMAMRREYFRAMMPKVDAPRPKVEPPAGMTWISCDDNPPSGSSHQMYFLWNGRYMRYGKWLSSYCSGGHCCWYDDFDHKIRGRKITHYMPVPAPPGENNYEDCK